MDLGGITKSSDIHKLYSFEPFIFLAIWCEFGLHNSPLSEETFPMAHVEARASPRDAEPRGAARTRLQCRHSLRPGRAWMAALGIPRVVFGSARRPRTRCCQPYRLRWLTLGTRRCSCGFG